MANKFCRYLSNGYTFNSNKSDLGVRPCCFFKGASIPVDSSLGENRKKYFESITDWTSACEVCYNLEKTSQPSLRQASNDYISADEQSSDPIEIDIQLDAMCNAACVMCNEGDSSLWKTEKLKLTNNKIKSIKIDNAAVDNSIKKIIDSVSLKKLKYVKIYGGEPLFTDTHLKFIKHIPYPENVVLHYTTNGSIYPTEEIIETWSKFKFVLFAASLDGIDKQFDYVRWPLTWKKVSKNLLRIKNNKKIHNVLFRVEFTANLCNTYYYDKLEKWVADNLATNLWGDPTEINIHCCSYGIWKLDKMPISVRDLIMSKYPPEHTIHQMVKNLLPPDSLVPWQNFVQTWDSHRNNSWQIAFPELVDHFKN
jgi:organic radical activating enzyme